MARLRVVWWILCVAAGCSGSRRADPVPTPEPPPPVVVEPTLPATGPELPVYTLEEALADVLSGPLEHIGTGPWHGIHRLHACAYRNARVIVVNVYCSVKEARAFRVDVFSPTRGRARIYAEGKIPVSSLTRRDYFSFTGEAEPPPPRRAGLPPLTLNMSFPELQSYERQRYGRFLPTCYGGVEVHRPQGGCLQDLAPYAGDWARRNQPFLDQPPEDWYRLIRELRALAPQHGRDL